MNHAPIFATNPGSYRTLEILSLRYYWPDMCRVVETCVHNFQECQRLKPRHVFKLLEGSTNSVKFVELLINSIKFLEFTTSSVKILVSNKFEKTSTVPCKVYYTASFLQVRLKFYSVLQAKSSRGSYVFDCRYRVSFKFD
jgi:hypothetical protein